MPGPDGGRIDKPPGGGDTDPTVPMPDGINDGFNHDLKILPPPVVRGGDDGPFDPNTTGPDVKKRDPTRESAQFSDYLPVH